MTELMQLLYNYTLETEFRTQLHTDSYRIKKLNTDQLNRQLHHTLPENLQPTRTPSAASKAPSWRPCSWPPCP